MAALYIDRTCAYYAGKHAGRVILTRGEGKLEHPSDCSTRQFRLLGQTSSLSLSDGVREEGRVSGQGAGMKFVAVFWGEHDLDVFSLVHLCFD